MLASDGEEYHVAVIDDFFGPVFIDIDEWRSEPVRFRYVHGGFEGTETRFSFYLPEPEHYQGRFLHFLEGGPGGNEDTALSPMPFVADIRAAVACGAYLVESNQGHIGTDLSGAKGDPSIICWRASAEAARYSRVVAEEMYGERPHHGYVFGGSGGGVRSLKCLEMVDDVWNGGVPFVLPHASQGNFFSMQLNALRVLQPQLSQISDAVEVGGSGHPFAGLDADQADALATLYKAGFPRGVSLDNPLEAVLVWTWFTDLFHAYDPTYFDDFWSQPGYLGHDHPERLTASVIDIETTVTRAVAPDELLVYQPTPPVIDRFGIGDLARLFGSILGTNGPRSGLTVAEGDTGAMGCATVSILSGRAAGREINVIGVIGDVLVGSALGQAGTMLFDGVESGDRVRICNRNYLAFCHHYRHQVEAEYPEWGHLAVDGEPLYPQRPILEKLFSAPYTYEVGAKKMIFVQNMLDRGTWPCGAVRYHERMHSRLGSDVDKQLRVWFVEHAQHVPASMIAASGHPETHAQLIDYEGLVYQAVADLIDWVEHDKEPPLSTNYSYSTDNAVTLSPSAVKRGGIQPVIVATANGQTSTRVAHGQTVTLRAEAEAPPGAGRIIRIEWDPAGDGSYPITEDIEPGLTHVTSQIEFSYDRPSTYLAAVRVTAHRDGLHNAPLFSLRNLGRVRVVVD
jgi:hypothetical protein